MNTRQFEKLQQIAKEASDLIVQLKLENRKLKQENFRLNEKFDEISNNGPKEFSEKINEIKIENTRLQKKQEIISSRLVTILDRVKGLAEGVEL